MELRHEDLLSVAPASLEGEPDPAHVGAGPTCYTPAFYVLLPRRRMLVRSLPEVTRRASLHLTTRAETGQTVVVVLIPPEPPVHRLA
jgi:hypothetical protein